MKKTILTAAAIALLLSGCSKAPAENTAETAAVTTSETAVTSAQTEIEETAEKPLPGYAFELHGAGCVDAGHFSIERRRG